MVQLFLDGVLIIPDASTSITVTKENPYFTLSDSYTLEISAPLDIYGNKRFFGSIQRTEKSKSCAEYKARLLADNKQILVGKARITQLNEKEVKLQLTTGVSALKMTADNGQMYIDEMDLGDVIESYLSAPIEGNSYLDVMKFGREIPIWDTSNDVGVNIPNFIQNILLPPTHGSSYVAYCISLMGAAVSIAYKLGYDLRFLRLPAACANIYIVSPVGSKKIKKKLPHWTVSEFFEQLQNFFGCMIEEGNGYSLYMSPLKEYIDRQKYYLEPSDELEVDYTEEDELGGVVNSNIEYKLNSSDTEVIDDDILKKAKGIVYCENFSDAWNKMVNNNENKKSFIYDVDGLKYIAWENGEYLELKRIAPFNPLNRYPDSDMKEIKISPVYIGDTRDIDIYWGNTKRQYSARVPEVSNPYEPRHRVSAEQEDEEVVDLQALIEGETESSSSGKEDVISVAFLGDQKTFIIKNPNSDDDDYKLSIKFAFTDAKYKTQRNDYSPSWSLSLNEVKGYEFYLGELHKLPFRINKKCKYKIKFESDNIPDPKNIFIIRNKMFGCEKIEATIENDVLSRQMTGYFYELTLL